MVSQDVTFDWVTLIDKLNENGLKDLNDPKAKPIVREAMKESYYNNMPVRELFLLQYAKDLCDTVFGENDINHDVVDEKDYFEYMNFMQEVLSFFLTNYRDSNPPKVGGEISTKDSQSN